MNFLTTTPLRAYLFTFAVHICTKRLIVSVAILSNALISHEPNRYSYKKGKHFDLPYIIWQQTRIVTALSETRLRDKELWDPGYIAEKDTIPKKKLTRHVLRLV